MIFEKKHFLSKSEVKRWAWKDYNVFKEAFKGSPSIREKVWNKFQEYWPDSLGSLTKMRLEMIEKKVKRDAIYGETYEKKKDAQQVLKFLEAFKKYFPG